MEEKIAKLRVFEPEGTETQVNFTIHPTMFDQKICNAVTLDRNNSYHILLHLRSKVLATEEQNQKARRGINFAPWDR